MENPWENIELLKSIIDSSTNHLCIVKPVYNQKNEIEDFEFILCNPSYCKYEKMSLEGCRLSSTHEAKRHGELFEMLKRVQQSGEKEEFDFLDPSTNCWFHIRLINTGKNVLIAKEDITRRKKVEEELKEQAHFISSVTDTMPDIVSVMEWPSKKLVYTNRTPFKDFGFDFILKISERERDNYIHPDDKDVLKDYYASFATLPDDGLVKCDYRAINEKGEWMWFKVRGKVFERDRNGKVKSFVNVIQNISDLKLAEQQLKEHLHFVNQVAVTIPDMLTVMELDTLRIFYANNKPFLENGFDYNKIAAYTIEEKAQVIHPEDLEAVRAYFRNFKSYSDDKIQSLEYRAHTNAGEWMWFRVRGKVFKRNENGEPVQCVNIVQNINNLKMAEEALLDVKLKQQKEILNAIIYTQEQERERIGESLHNGVAQLLYGIQTRLQLLNATDSDSEKNIREINSILKEAIVDTRNISFELVPTVLKDHGIEVALRALFQRIIKDKPHVELQTQGLKQRIPEKIEFAIYRIIQELINNILKHAGASTALINLTLKRKWLQLTVSDNGSGFDRKTIRGIHKGIGLQSVENRVKLLNGTFKIKTGPLGTTVQIDIPVN